jgi:hypothetical protein
MLSHPRFPLGFASRERERKRQIENIIRKIIEICKKHIKIRYSESEMR